MLLEQAAQGFAARPRVVVGFEHLELIALDQVLAGEYDGSDLTIDVAVLAGDGGACRNPALRLEIAGKRGEPGPEGLLPRAVYRQRILDPRCIPQIHRRQGGNDGQGSRKGSEGFSTSRLL